LHVTGLVVGFGKSAPRDKVIFDVMLCTRMKWTESAIRGEFRLFAAAANWPTCAAERRRICRRRGQVKRRRLLVVQRQ